MKNIGKNCYFGSFVLIIRTVAPFVAGIGTMVYPRFLFYNIMGGTFWVVAMTMLDFFFGNIPIVKENFSFVIFIIMMIFVLPGLIGVLRQRCRAH